MREDITFRVLFLFSTIIAIVASACSVSLYSEKNREIDILNQRYETLVCKYRGLVVHHYNGNKFCMDLNTKALYSITGE